MKFYGSLENRLEENRMYCDEIKVGTGMTEYSYSDRHAYEVVKVIDQKHVFVREYDHKAIGEHMSNEWELVSNPEHPVKEMKFRYGYWNWVDTVTKEDIENCIIIDDKLCKALKELETKDEAVIYRRANVSFGVADYYYDYEF